MPFRYAEIIFTTYRGVAAIDTPLPCHNAVDIAARYARFAATYAPRAMSR